MLILDVRSSSKTPWKTSPEHSRQTAQYSVTSDSHRSDGIEKELTTRLDNRARAYVMKITQDECKVMMSRSCQEVEVKIQMNVEVK